MAGSIQELSLVGNAWRRLCRQLEAKLSQQDFLVGLGLCVAREDQGATVGGGEGDVEHLDSGKLVQDGAWGQAAGQWTQPGPQRPRQPARVGDLFEREERCAVLPGDYAAVAEYVAMHATPKG